METLTKRSDVMFTYVFAQVLLALYAVFLAFGGALGYYDTETRPSLFAGTGGAALCFIALLYSVFVDPQVGLQAATLVALVMTFYFNYRFVGFKPRFIPAGMLALMSLVVFGSLLITII